MQNAKAPFKFLLHSNQQKNTGGRSQEEIQLLSELSIKNRVFQDLNLPKNTLQQLCDKMTLIWADHPHSNELNENQLYLLLEGKAFEFIQNKNPALKSRLKDEEYLMVRKLLPNDFFIVSSPQTKYSQPYDFKKYQLMIDQNTLVGKISGETFKRYVQPFVEDRWRRIVGFLRKVHMLHPIPQILLYELSKYLTKETYPAGKMIIRKDQKNHNVYFIESGQAEYRVYNNTTTSKQSPNKNYHTIHTKPFKKLLLKQNDVFGIDALNPTEKEKEKEVNNQYSIETRSPCTVYQVDKRILAIVISSNDTFSNKRAKILSSVNLNDQIQGQGYRNADLDILSRNAQKIKSTEKRIRDIKLRLYNSSQKNRAGLQEEDPDNNDDFLYDIEDVKYQSCQNFNNIKVTKERSERLANTYTFHENIKIQNMDQQRDSKNKMTNLVITPYESETEAEPLQKRKMITSQMQRTAKTTFMVKRKSDPYVVPSGKEESDIIRTYLEKKLKSEMLRKAEHILERNQQNKVKDSVKLKRIYSLKSSTSKNGRYNEMKSSKDVDEQLYDRMNKLVENPLLSKIQGQRKKLESQTKKLRESQAKNIKKSGSPQKTGNANPNHEKIVISN